MENKRTYKNVEIVIEERISKKTDKPYICVVGKFKDTRGNEKEILLGFDHLAKDIVFNV